MEFQRSAPVIISAFFIAVACKSTGNDGAQSLTLGSDEVGGSAGRVVQIRSVETASEPLLFDLSDAMIKQRYPLVQPWEKASQFIQSSHGTLPTRRFGFFELVRPGVGSILIPEMPFPSDQGWWFKPVPVSDDPSVVVAKSGQRSWRGSELVDEFVAKKFGRQKTDAMAVLSVFGHPEVWKGEVFDLANADFDNLLKFEQGQTHVGFYIGGGRTRNSPPDYHDQKWGLNGYPVNLFALEYVPVDQGVFMNNLAAMVELLQLHGGPKAPDNYKQDILRAVSLQETLDHFRGWIDHEWIRPLEKRIYGRNAKPFFWYLKNQEVYATNCSEFVTIALNLAVNLPLNSISFQEIWGKKEGKKLWLLANKHITSAVSYQDFGSPQRPPLWKKMGMKSPARSKKVGAGLLWDPLSTSDMFGLFIRRYANWANIGANNTLAFLLGMAPNLVDRMKINPNEYFAAIEPIVSTMFLHEQTVITNKAYISYLSDKNLYTDYLKANLLDSPLVQASQNYVDQTHAANVARYQTELSNYNAAMKLYNVAKSAYDGELAAFNRGEIVDRPDMPALPIAPMAVTSKPFDLKEKILRPLFDELSSSKNLADFNSLSKDLNNAWDSFLKDIQSPMKKLKDQEILTAFPGTDQVSMVAPDGRGVVGVRFYSPPQIFQRIVDKDLQLNQYARLVPLGHIFDSEELKQLPSARPFSYQID